VFRRLHSKSSASANSFSDFKEFEREALSHLDALMAFARRLTRSQTEAEDLVQDTFVKALRARDQYETGTNLRAWLLRIERNTFINRYHRGSLERSVTTGPQADPVSDAWVSAATMRATRDPEGQALKPELARHLSAAIDRLPEEFRTVVLLADVEEFAYKEIAETLGCPIGTVMSRLHRARKLLKAALLQHGRDSGLIEPEATIGETTGADKGGASAAIDLDAYRGRVAGRGSR
jgi:RNA polymerase sigma-70 factor (ECF subfamily)